MSKNKKFLNRLKFILLAFSLFYIWSCQASYVKSSPTIKLRNSTADGSLIKNIRIIWNEYELLGSRLQVGSDVGRCGLSGESFNLKHEPDFFGPVHVEWENAQGQKLTKDFVFKKEDLPSYKYRGQQDVYSYVTLYFGQSDVEYYTSDNPRIKEIEAEKAGDWIIDYIEGRGQVCIKNPKEVKRLKEFKKRTTYCVNKKGEKISCDNLYRKFYYDRDGEVKELK